MIPVLRLPGYVDGKEKIWSMYSIKYEVKVSLLILNCVQSYITLCLIFYYTMFYYTMFNLLLHYNVYTKIVYEKVKYQDNIIKSSVLCSHFQ